MNNVRYSDKTFPVDFQAEIVSLVKNVVAASAVRFCLVNPSINIRGFVSYNVDSKTEEIYQYMFRDLDPLHPKNFENTDVRVVCSDTLMPEEEWRKSCFYREFMAPRHYDHNADVFFRRDGRIIAVLSVLRSDEIGPFNEAELKLLKNLQPFVEYTLNSIYLPQRVTEREYFSEKYAFTNRELDVLETVMAGVEIKTMARELNLSTATVKTHLQHIFEKVGVRSSKELISTLFRELTH